MDNTGSPIFERGVEAVRNYRLCLDNKPIVVHPVLKIAPPGSSVNTGRLARTNPRRPRLASEWPKTRTEFGRDFFPSGALPVRQTSTSLCPGDTQGAASTSLAPCSNLRRQQRITTTGKSTHDDKVDIQCDASPYPRSPAAPKGNTNTVNELRASSASR